MATANATVRSTDQKPLCLSHPSVEDAARRILTVSSDIQGREVLTQVLLSHACPRHWTSSVQEAADWLSTNTARVIICDDSLPDGDWRELWQQVRDRPEPPVFVVSAGAADARLWAEVLNVGAYDVLVKPYVTNEVSRILQHACRTVKRSLEGQYLWHT
jgi:DNA-binding NtrC family response regulator